LSIRCIVSKYIIICNDADAIDSFALYGMVLYYSLAALFCVHLDDVIDKVAPSGGMKKLTLTTVVLGVLNEAHTVQYFFYFVEERYLQYNW
jgi:hypothetical protein